MHTLRLTGLKFLTRGESVVSIELNQWDDITVYVSVCFLIYQRRMGEIATTTIVTLDADFSWGL